MGLTEAELAERSACPVERIEELVALGILVPRDEDGQFSPKDVHRVRLMTGFEDAGIDLDLIARGVEKGKLSYENLAPKRTPSPPAIAFLDLTGYTALTEERGDEAGADLAERLATLVHEAARPHGGNPVKWLGDGVMFHFEDPSAAVLTGLDLVEQTPAAVDVRARVGINAGNVIFRDGDYFGRTVNVASRIADYARPGEVLVSGEVKERWGGDGVRFEEIGPVALKGLREELTLYAASRHTG